jgi:hypothetical protein
MKKIFLLGCFALTFWIVGCEKCKNCKVIDETRIATTKDVPVVNGTDTTWRAVPDTTIDIKEGAQEYCGRELNFVDTAANKKVTAISRTPYLGSVSKVNNRRRTGTIISYRTIDCN